MTYLFGFVVLLGVLIFIHELGHFLLAKAVGVRVETFSIGMGPKIFKFTKGETEYALSLIPLGGYVKLTGQDPREEVPKELEHRSFRHKTLSQRTAVVLAGPLFNAALTVILFVVLFSLGAPSAAPVLGRVVDQSEAYQAGLRTGDWVASVEIDGTEHRTLDANMLGSLIQENAGKTATFTIQSPEAEESKKATVSLISGQGRDATLGVPKERGLIPGVEAQARAPLIQVASGSWADERQLPPSLWIRKVEAKIGAFNREFEVRTFHDLETVWNTLSQETSEEGRIVFTGQRAALAESMTKGEETPEVSRESFTLAWTYAEDQMPSSLSEAGIRSSELFVIEVVEDSPASQLGLQPGDELISLNNETIKSFPLFRSRLQELASSGNSLELSWRRGGEVMGSTVTPKKVTTTDPLTEAKKDQFQIGAAFMALPAEPLTYTLKADGLGHAIALGWNRSVALTISMVESFYFLATGQISPKTIGGPILIGKIAGESVKQGWEAFVKMMAFISLNLFILNLLPIPVLDGGHLVLFAVEAVTRKPLSLKAIEIWTTAGFFFLMSLIAIVFFNDLNRLGLFNIFKS